MRYEIFAKEINLEEYRAVIKALQKADFRANENSRYVLNGKQRSLITILGDIRNGKGYAILADEENPLARKAKEVCYRTLASYRLENQTPNIKTTNTITN